MTELDAFLLSREWRDRDGGVELVLWRAADTPVRARFPGQESVMFVPRGTATRAGRVVRRRSTTLQGQPVDALYFRSQRALIDERERLRGDVGSLRVRREAGRSASSWSGS